MKTESWTVRDILSWSVAYLKKTATQSARLDAELLLAAALDCQRLGLYLNYDKPLSQEERSLFRDYLRRRAAGEPVAYILGYREFFGLKFEVNPAVLIPRPETEHVVEQVESLLEGGDLGSDARILDLGTGSGCIGITLKKRGPGLFVDAWDICDQALTVARRNADSYDLSIGFYEKNALQAASWQLEPGKAYDIICTNPPYIGESESDIDAAVAKFEPHKALFAESDGFCFYEALAKFAPRSLSAKGYIVAEIGAAQGPKVLSLFRDSGWRDVRLHPDLAGHDRIVTACYERQT